VLLPSWDTRAGVPVAQAAGRLAWRLLACELVAGLAGGLVVWVCLVAAQALRSVGCADCPAWPDGGFGRVLGWEHDPTEQEAPFVASASREIAAGSGRIFELIANPAQ